MRSIATLLTVLLVMTSSFANAQDSNAERVMRAAYQDGTRFYEQRNYKQAYQAFEKGYKVANKPGFLWNMAECARMQGDNERARELYHKYLDGAPDGTQRKLTLQRLAALPPPPTPSVETTDQQARTISVNYNDKMNDEKTRKPITKKWWFWTASVLVVGGVAATVGIVMSKKGSQGLNVPNNGAIGTGEGTW